MVEMVLNVKNGQVKGSIRVEGAEFRIERGEITESAATLVTTRKIGGMTVTVVWRVVVVEGGVALTQLDAAAKPASGKTAIHLHSR